MIAILALVFMIKVKHIVVIEMKITPYKLIHLHVYSPGNKIIRKNSSLSLLEGVSHWRCTLKYYCDRFENVVCWSNMMTLRPRTRKPIECFEQTLSHTITNIKTVLRKI